MGGRGDLIGVVDAIYDVERPSHAWIEAVMRGAERALDAREGIFGVLYDTRIGQGIRASVAVDNCGGRLAESTTDCLKNLDPGYVTEYVQRKRCVLISDSSPGQSAFEHTLGRVGFRDLLVINGIDPSGLGCYLGVPLRRRGRLSSARRSELERLGGHLAAGHRLMHRTRRLPPEAVLTPEGDVQEASGEAAEAVALGALRAAVQRIARTRETPAATLRQWKPLVSGRWTITDSFETCGSHYLLAQRNESHLRGPSTLTARERAVVAHLALGHSLKVVAYELGIAHSTVRVFVTTLCRKLGLSSGAELREWARSTGARTEPPTPHRPKRQS